MMQSMLKNKNEEEVISFLKQNPLFLIKHMKELEMLIVPHFAKKPKKVVSLIEHQVCVLKDKNKQLSTQLRELIQIAQNNELLWKKTQKMMLKLIQQDSLKDLIETSYESAQETFSMEYFSLILFSNQTTLDSKNYCRILKKEQVEKKLKMKIPHKTLCNTFRKDWFDFLFGASIQGSALISPLITESKQLIGLFALGHQDDQHFHSQLDTSFIDFFLKILSEEVMRLLPENFNTEYHLSLHSR